MRCNVYRQRGPAWKRLRIFSCAGGIAALGGAALTLSAGAEEGVRAEPFTPPAVESAAAKEMARSILDFEVTLPLAANQEGARSFQEDALWLEQETMEAPEPVSETGGETSAEALNEPVWPAAETSDGLIAGGGVRTGWRKNVFPHFRFGGFYDDNIFISEFHRESDFIAFAGFGLRLGVGEVQAPLYTLRETRNVPHLYEAPPQPFGNYVLADYSGTYFAFADHSEQNAYDQDALLSAGWMGSKLSLGFEARFQSLSSPDIDVGRRVRRYITGLTGRAEYDLSPKTSLETDISFVSTQYRSNLDSNEFLNENWLNLELTPKLKIAPGIGFGLLTIQESPDQPFGRALLRIVYDYSEKLAFNGRIGVEYRDLERGSGFRNNPVFGLGATYIPFESTTISMSAYRTAEASAVLAGADYTRTGVDLKVRQRFLQRFHVTLTGGYENLDYHAVSRASIPARSDDYVFGRASVAFDVTRWGTAEVFYNYQRDSSSHPGNSFTDNQVGIEIDLAF